MAVILAVAPLLDKCSEVLCFELTSSALSFSWWW